MTRMILWKETLTESKLFAGLRNKTMHSNLCLIKRVKRNVICPLTAELDVTPICQGCYSCFHVPLASASQVPAEGSGSGRQRGCLTGAIASRVAGKTLGAAGLECFGQGSTLQQLWFILLIIWCWEHLICNSGKLPLPVLKGAPGSFTLVAELSAPATAFLFVFAFF